MKKILSTVMIVLIVSVSIVSLFATRFVQPISAAKVQIAQDGEALCPALPAPGGNIVNVSTVTQLVNAVNGAASGDTILIADGQYNLDGAYLRIDTPQVTLRSASGNRSSVVLDGNYATTEIIQIVASDVIVADITLREAYYHPIHVMTGDADTLNTLIYNVSIIDPGEQAIKINPAGSGYPDDGTIACSHIQLTDAGRPHIRNNCYTGGIDAHQARNWTIRDNVIEGFWCASGLSEHGIHMWRGCRDTTIERNVLNNNARGIGLGLVTSGTGRTYGDNPCPDATGYVDDFGGIIRNNFVFANSRSLFSSNSGFDTGIAIWNSCHTQVLHNTVASTQTPSASSIEWRFDNTEVELRNNLVTNRLWDRGGDSTLSGNLDYQLLSLFVDGSNGDLHLAETAVVAIDQVGSLSDVVDDIDGDSRPIGAAADIGADEYGIPSPNAVIDLRVAQVISDTNPVRVTLNWTPPANAITTTIRYAETSITDAGWDSAVILTDTLSGDAYSFEVDVPYDGDVLYFALKSEGEGGVSDLSNNAFWPSQDVYLPLVIK